VPGVLILAVEGLLFGLLAADAGRDFALLDARARLSVAAIALLALVPLALRRWRRRGPRRVHAAALVLSLTAAAVAILVTSVDTGEHRMLERWDDGAPQRLQARADLLEADVRDLLLEMTRPFDTRLADSSDRKAAFRLLQRDADDTRLPADRYGLALYAVSGEPFAWSGNSTLAPPELLATADSTVHFLAAGNEEAPRVYAARRDAFSGLTRVAEFLMRSPAGARPGEAEGAAHLEFMPHWSAIEPASVQVLLAKPAAEDMATLFAHSGDRHWWRVGRQRQLTLSVPLRDPSGTLLLTSNLADRRAAQELAVRRAAARRLATLSMAFGLLLAAVILLRHNTAPLPARLLLATAAIWGVRILLLLIGPDDALPALPVYDITAFSSSALWGLFRSPLDLLFTAAAAAAQAWLVNGALRSLPQPRGASGRLLRFAAFCAGLLAAAATLAGLHLFLDRLVVESRVDISRVDLDRDLPARLVLQAGVFLLIWAAAIFVEAFFRLAFRRDPATPPRPDLVRGLPPSVRTALAVLLLTVLYVPFVSHSYLKLRHEFFERDLLPRVQHQAEGRRSLLRDSLSVVEQPEFASVASLDEDPSAPGSLAYRLWSRTPLAAVGLASSLRIFDLDGRLLSRFAVNLGIMFENQFWEAREAASTGVEPIAVPPHEGVTIKKNVLFGARWVSVAHQPDRLVVLTVIDDYDNVPLLGAESAYLPLLRSRAVSRTNPELIRFEPMMAVFGPSLERLYESGGEIPVPSPRTLDTLSRRPSLWIDEAVGEGPASILYFRGPEAIFALAFPRRDWAGLVASCLRLTMLNGFIVLLAAAAQRGALFALGRPRPRTLLGPTLYARLTAVFLLTALAPLLALAWFVTRVSTRESERDLIAAGLTSLQTVRRVADDYLNLPDPGYGRDLDDEVVFWLSRVVRQDINVYRDADLVASSTRELYGSSLLNTRLDGQVYRALYLDREPVRLARARVGDFDYLTLSAPMRIDPEGGRGVVSIPLAAQSRAVARKAEELADAVLILSSVTVALLALVGWQVARRVSEPIAALSFAARRMATGDLEARVTARGADEIGSLVDAFNGMAESLQKQTSDLSRRKVYIETILQRATAGVLSLDARGVVITANPAAQQILARQGPSPAAGDSLPERLQAEPRLAPLAKALERSLDGDLEGEVTIAIGSGDDERRLRAVFLPFTPEEGALQGRIVLLEDVTEIVRSGRLAAWAEMARRVAHEVKNPLTPIQLAVEHVRRLWQANDPRFGAVLAECLDNIQGQVRALRQIATEFSTYARLPALRLEPTGVDNLLGHALRPYLASPPLRVDIASVVPPDLPEVMVDRAVMTRVLVNLVENALQAMPEGGRLEVSAHSVSGNGRPGVRISVRDSGIGIPPDILSRIFEPYFSTKSGGTGLGLAIARRAVEEHGGLIDIQSRPGKGTHVTLFLPARAA
jgi:signal transduction histidine kinase/HAMP domain-containing protein